MRSFLAAVRDMDEWRERSCSPGTRAEGGRRRLVDLPFFLCSPSIGERKKKKELFPGVSNFFSRRSAPLSRLLALALGFVCPLDLQRRVIEVSCLMDAWKASIAANCCPIGQRPGKQKIEKEQGRRETSTVRQRLCALESLGKEEKKKESLSLAFGCLEVPLSDRYLECNCVREDPIDASKC